ncbi:spindle pole body component 110-like [Gossypium hirsutum]|uniref:Spindle pole body component 110-like n=1 Tax=Gossypium hirsutum TaxID=3635 RepID=A0A1U8PDM3_GOSHI|nr:spindle pole body component 110-like [Gossypium hirsutum]
MKQEFERKNSELEKRMEKLEEEKMCLSLDVDVQKIEVEKVKKEKRKIEEDRDDLKTHYKKAQVTLKRVGLGRSLEQWQQEIQEERAKAEYWEKKFQEMQSLELKAILNKIEEMKHNIGGLETTLQDCEQRIEQLEAGEEQWKGELHHLRDQVRDRDYVMEEALVQIRGVAEHLQDLAIQARTLSIMYESSSDRGRELALLLDRVKTLGLRAKVYL